MTALALEYKQKSPLPGLLLILMALVGFLAAGLAGQPTSGAGNITVGGKTILLNHHAVLKHGMSAINARHCLDNNDPFFMLRERSGRIHLICHDKEADTFYDMIVNCFAEGMCEEVTSFRPDPGYLGNKWSVIKEWLMKKGTPIKSW